MKIEKKILNMRKLLDVDTLPTHLWTSRKRSK